MLTSPPWTILLIGGASDNGKTFIAERLGQHYGVPWLQVDDLRLALQYGGLVTASTHPSLFTFLDEESVWTKPPQILSNQLITIGELLAPAIEVIVAHHLATEKPLIIEGDGLLPTLFARAALRDTVATGRVRGLFLTATTATRRTNMIARDRGFNASSDEQRSPGDNMNARYDAWLCQEAVRHRLPLIEAQPPETLLERIITALAGGSG